MPTVPLVMSDWLAGLQQRFLSDHALVVAEEMPFAGVITGNHGRFTMQSAVNVSAAFELPWTIPDIGTVRIRTGALAERSTGYRLSVELARGELGRMAEHLALLEQEGKPTGPEIRTAYRESLRLLGQAVRSPDLRAADELSQQSLRLTHLLGEQLAVLRGRAAQPWRQETRQPMAVGGRLDIRPDPQAINNLANSFDYLRIPVDWALLEPEPGEYCWGILDAKVDAVAAQRLPVTLGPIVALMPDRIPAWLHRWHSDPQGLTQAILGFVNACATRYRGRVTDLEVALGTHSATFLPLNEEHRLWLTQQMLDAARVGSPHAQLWLGIDQPWGEYLRQQASRYTPFAWCDRLSRGSTTVGFLLEVAMSYAPLGTYCRPPLDFADLLRRFSHLEAPLAARLGFPNSRQDNHPGGRATIAGNWHDSPSPQAQADWIRCFGAVALAEPAVTRLEWCRFQDAAEVANDRGEGTVTSGLDVRAAPGEPSWPHAGLVSSQNAPRPAFAALQELRSPR